MSLERVPPIQYIDSPTDYSFLPAFGVHTEQARSMAADFAIQERGIILPLLDRYEKGRVIYAPDNRWHLARTTNFDILGRRDNQVFLTVSQHGDKVAAQLGVDTNLVLGTEDGPSFFFDDKGNFAKASQYTDESWSGYAQDGNFVYYRHQMSAGDFESVGMMLAEMRIGTEPLRQGLWGD